LDKEVEEEQGLHVEWAKWVSRTRLKYKWRKYRQTPRKPTVTTFWKCRTS